MKLKIRPGLASLLLLASFFAFHSVTTYAQPSGERGMRLAAGAPVKTLPGSAKRYAIVIGVDKYADTQITTLGGATNDAQALARALVAYAGFPADNVTLLASNQPAERQPTRGNVLRRLSNLAAVVPQDGLLLFAFAGHGIERGGQAFLLPADSQVSNDVDLLEQTAINVTQVKDRVRKAGVRQVLMILDACRNDPIGRANADNPLTRAYTRGFNFDVRNREVSAFATLYATDVGKRAYEYKEKRQGYFTWALVEGLRGAAANPKGEVTLAGLVSYLQERVPKKVSLDLGSGKEQRPFAVIEGYRANELVIAVPNPKAAAVDNFPADAPADATSAASADNRGGDGSITISGSPRSLEGTTWEASTPEVDLSIAFLKDGKLTYTNTITKKSVPGTWRQVGNVVQLSINNGYSVLNGNIENGVIKLEGVNTEGTKFGYTLFPK